MIWGWWFWSMLGVVAVVLLIYFLSKKNRKD